VTFLVVNGDREFLLEPGEEQGTDLGVIELPEDAEAGETIETHLGEPFTVRALRGPDLFDHFERTGAPMVPRDVGLMIGYTGIAGGDRVLDAGTGTGVLAAYLGRIGVEVETYERDERAAEVARENMELAGVADRVTVHTGDVLEAIDGAEADTQTDLGTFDHVTLDTGDAAAVVERVPSVLGSGGYVAVYTPFVESAREVTEAARSAELEDIETIETIERRMDFDDRGSRPGTAPVGHTGYLSIARKS
jgi:tRNA (adenine57-N1/adenine58-N1)-methyltransferase